MRWSGSSSTTSPPTTARSASTGRADNSEPLPWRISIGASRSAVSRRAAEPVASSSATPKRGAKQRTLMTPVSIHAQYTT